MNILKEVAILNKEAVDKEFGQRKRTNVIIGVVNALSCLPYDCFLPTIHLNISSKNIMLDLKYVAHASNFKTTKFLKLDSLNWKNLLGHMGMLHQVCIHFHLSFLLNVIILKCYVKA